MIDDVTSQMAKEDQQKFMSKITLFERYPKAALLAEIEVIIDEEKRYFFEELREKVLSGDVKKEMEILDEVEAEEMVRADKKDCMEILRSILSDHTSLEQKL